MTVDDDVVQGVQTVSPRATHAACTEARLLFEGDLEAARVVQQDIAMAAMALGELLSNGVRHGKPFADGTLEVSWSLQDQTVHVAVRDAGVAPRLEARLPEVDSATGRGLWMIAQVCQRWGVEQDDGTRVWAIFSATRRA